MGNARDGGQSREADELLDQMLQARDFVGNRSNALLDNRRDSRRRGGQACDIPCYAFGRKLNRGEGISNLVSKPSRHIAPRARPLGADDLREVFYHEHKTSSAE